MDITLPNGSVIQGVPEGTSKEDIKKKAIAAGLAVESDFGPSATSTTETTTEKDATQEIEKQQGVPADPSLLDRWGETGSKYLENMGRVSSDYRSGKISYPSSLLQSMGNTAGLVVGGLGDALTELFTEVVPDAALSYMENGITGLMQTEQGKKLVELAAAGGAEWDAFSTEYPEMAGNIAAVAKIAELTPMGKIVKRLSVLDNPIATTVDSIGEASIKSGAKSAAKQSRNIADNLLTPLDTPSARDAFRGRWDNKARYIPDDYDEKMRSTVSQHAKISPKNSDMGNYNAIMDSIEKEAISLENRLKGVKGVTIKKEPLKQELRKNIDTLLKKSTTMVGDAPQVAERIAQHADELIDGFDGSLSGLLKVRKDLDSWVKGQSGNIWDAGNTASKEAARNIRDTLKGVIVNIANTRGIDVSKSLDLQHTLYSASDLAWDRARIQSKSVLESLAKKVKTSTGLTVPSTPLSLLGTANMGAMALGLGTGATGVAAVGGIGLSAVVAGAMVKGAISPQARAYLGKSLKALSSYKGDIAAERAAIIEAMRLPTDKNADVTLEESQINQ